MPDDASLNQLAFQNLLLLGFDPADALARYGVEVAPGTLLEAAGVQRHMEVVMHFCILKCFPEAAQGMKLHWPIVEKAQARDFRKLVTDKLILLQREHEIPPNPVIRSTLMDSAGGAKFLSVLFHTTQAAMRRGLAQMKQPPAVTLAPYDAKDGPSLQRLARLHASRQRKRFLSRLADVKAAHERWRAFGERAGEAYEAVVEERQRAKGEMDALMAGPHANVMWAVAESARKETAAEDVGKVWRRVEGHIANVAGQVGAVEEVLLDEGGRPCIDVGRLKDKSKPVSEERAELEALLQGWAACISQLHNKLTHSHEGHASLLRFAAGAGDVKAAEDVGKEQLRRLRALRQELESQVAQTQGAISDFMSKQRGTSQRAPATPTRHAGGAGHVGLMPPTPAGALDLTASPFVSAAPQTGRYFQNAPDVEEVMEHVRASVRGQEDPWQGQFAPEQPIFSSASSPSKPSASASPSVVRSGQKASGTPAENNPVLEYEAAALAVRQSLQKLRSPATSEGRCQVASPVKIAWSEKPLAPDGFLQQAASGSRSLAELGSGSVRANLGCTDSGDSGLAAGRRDVEADEEGDEAVEELRRRMQSLRQRLEDAKTSSPPRAPDIGIGGIKSASPVPDGEGGGDSAGGSSHLSARTGPAARTAEDLADSIASMALEDDPGVRRGPSFVSSTRASAAMAPVVEAWGDAKADGTASSIKATAYRPTPLVCVGEASEGSAIESRRAALRAKLEAAKHDSISPPSITSTWRSDAVESTPKLQGNLSPSISPPKIAGKGFAVEDDSGPF